MDKEYLTIDLSKLDDTKYHEAVQNASSILDTDDGEDWCNLILKVASEIKRREGLENAIRYLGAIQADYARIFLNLFDKNAEILKRTCYYNLENNNYDKAKENLAHYIYSALSQIDYKSTLRKMPYYSFRIFSDYSLKDVKEQKLTLSHPREFNDPLDTLLVWWMESEIAESHGSELDKKYTLLLKKVSEGIKIRCLSAGKTTKKEIPVEELSSLMWAHYANSHKGFCIEYDFDRDFFTKNHTKNHIVVFDNINYTDVVNPHGEPSIKDALFNKSEFWSYENEVRLVMFDEENEEDFPSLDCTGMIKAIYLGVKCSDENRRKMERAIGHKDIPLYQMKIDANNLTHFKKQQIG